MKENVADWKEVKLGTILRYLDERATIDDEKEYHTITVKRRHGGLEIREKLFGHQIATKKQFRLVPGSFIISRVQCWHQAYAIVGDVPLNTIASTNYDQFAISPEVDSRYFWWLSHSPAFTETVRSSAVGVVIEKMVFNREEWLAKSVRLPPLPEQRRVVARIEELAAKIHEARTLRHQTAEEAEVLFSRYRAVRFAELSDRFESRVLGDHLISMASGEGLTSSQMDDTAPYPVYGGGGLNGRYSRYLFEKPQIVIGRVGARCGCVFVTEPKAWVTDNALYLTKFSSDLDFDYLVHALSALDLRQQANQAAQPVVSQKKINPLPIAVPRLPEQRRIVAELDALQAEVNRLKAFQTETAAELNAMLAAILDRAFKGEL